MDPEQVDPYLELGIGILGFHQILASETSMDLVEGHGLIGSGDHIPIELPGLRAALHFAPIRSVTVWKMVSSITWPL